MVVRRYGREDIREGQAYEGFSPKIYNIKAQKTSSDDGGVGEGVNGRVCYENQPITHLGCSPRAPARAVTMRSLRVP